MSMSNELRVGGSYRIAVRGDTFRGSLEGRVRSLNVAPGALGNQDGHHPIWVSGALIDWFLGFDEVESAVEVEGPAHGEMGPRLRCRSLPTSLRRGRALPPDRRLRSGNVQGF
jgi:hypothetical protein